MSQSLRVKRELYQFNIKVPAGSGPGSNDAPRLLIDGMPWHSAASHSDVANFRQRQIERGMKPRETKP